MCALLHPNIIFVLHWNHLHIFMHKHMKVLMWRNFQDVCGEIFILTQKRKWIIYLFITLLASHSNINIYIITILKYFLLRCCFNSLFFYSIYKHWNFTCYIFTDLNFSKWKTVIFSSYFNFFFLSFHVIKNHFQYAEYWSKEFLKFSTGKNFLRNHPTEVLKGVLLSLYWNPCTKYLLKWLEM